MKYLLAYLFWITVKIQRKLLLWDILRLIKVRQAGPRSFLWESLPPPLGVWRHNDNTKCASVVTTEHFFQAAEVCIKYGADTCALQVRLSLTCSRLSVAGKEPRKGRAREKKRGKTKTSLFFSLVFFSSIPNYQEPAGERLAYLQTNTSNMAS